MARVHNHYPYEKNSSEGKLFAAIKRLILGLFLTIGLAIALYFLTTTLYKLRYTEVPTAKKVTAILSSIALALLGTAMTGVKVHDTLKKDV